MEPACIDKFPISPFAKRSADLLQEMPIGPFDIIYYDAFAPSKQPALWEIDILRKNDRHAGSGRVFVTYCAKGQLKRDLSSLGLTVETLAGPPGKRKWAARPVNV